MKNKKRARMLALYYIECVLHDCSMSSWSNENQNTCKQEHEPPHISRKQTEKEELVLRAEA